MLTVAQPEPKSEEGLQRSHSKIQRNPNFDLLRNFACLAVVVAHICASLLYSTPVHSANWFFADLFGAYSRFCVPVFVMLSGALLLGRPVGEITFDSYKHRFTRLMIPLIFWTLFYISFHSIYKHGFHPGNALRSIFSGNPYYHLWYLFMALGLSLFTPFIQQIVAANSKRTLILLSLTCLAIAAIESPIQSHSFLPFFIPYIGYYIIGYYLAHCEALPSRWLLALCAIGCGALVTVEIWTLFPRYGVHTYDQFYSLFNPFIIIMSACVFTFFLKLSRIPAWVTRLSASVAPITLGIYLIHPFWITLLEKSGFWGTAGHPFFGVPLATILITALSLASCVLISSVPILRKLVR